MFLQIGQTHKIILYIKLYNISNIINIYMYPIPNIPTNYKMYKLKNYTALQINVSHKLYNDIII